MWRLRREEEEEVVEEEEVEEEEGVEEEIFHWWLKMMKIKETISIQCRITTRLLSSESQNKTSKI